MEGSKRCMNPEIGFEEEFLDESAVRVSGIGIPESLGKGGDNSAKYG